MQSSPAAPKGNRLHPAVAKTNKAAPWAASMSSNGHFSFVPESDKLAFAHAYMSPAPVSSQPPSPETGATFTTDRGQSARPKTGRRHESCRIVVIRSRRTLLMARARRINYVEDRAKGGSPRRLRDR